MSAPVSSQALRSPDLPQNPLAVFQNRWISRRRAAPSAFVSMVFAVIAANNDQRSTQLRDQSLPSACGRHCEGPLMRPLDGRETNVPLVGGVPCAGNFPFETTFSEMVKIDKGIT